MPSVSSMIRLIPASWEAKLAPIWWAPPGIGKSDIVRKVSSTGRYRIKRPDGHIVSSVLERCPELEETYRGEHVGRKVFDVRLVLCTPTDLKGIPVYSSDLKTAIWVLSGLFPASASSVADLENALLAAPTDQDASYISKRLQSALHDQNAVLFLDEIAQAPQTVQAAAFSLVLDRKIGTYELPENVDIVSASNRRQDGAATNEMPTPLRSRLIHFTTDTPLYEDWVEWAEEHGVNQDILAYLSKKPDRFFSFDPKTLRGQGSDSAQSTYPCPRTWHFASRAMAVPGLGEQDLYDMLSGCVGPGTAGEFLAWKAVFRSLPPAMEVLTGKVKRKDLQFKMKDSDSLDISMEYAYVMLCYDELVRHIERATDHFLKPSKDGKKQNLALSSSSVSMLKEFLEFLEPPSSPEWKSLVFAKVTQTFNKHKGKPVNPGALIIREDCYRAVTSKLMDADVLAEL